MGSRYSICFSCPTSDNRAIDLAVEFDCRIRGDARGGLGRVKNIIKRHFAEHIATMDYLSFYKKFNTGEKAVELLLKPISNECCRNLISLDRLEVVNYVRTQRKYLGDGPRTDQ